MATVTCQNLAIAPGVIKTTWVVTGTDDGFPETAPQYPTKSVQVFGTFGGGTILIEGSNDGGVTWFTLTDGQGNNLSFTTAGGEKIQENTQKVRPRASVAVTSVTVVLVCQAE
jgi:hypothetical protein